MNETPFAAIPVQEPSIRNWPFSGLAMLFGVGLLLYCLSQWLAFAARIQPENISVFWPPAGVMLALLVVVPARFRWGMVAALAAATLLCNGLAGRALDFNVLLTLNDTAVGVLGASLYRRWIGFRSPVSGIVPYGSFLVIAAISALLSATLGSLIIHWAFGANMINVWHHWFGAMILGILVGAPLVVLAFERPAASVSFSPNTEFVAIVFASAVLLIVAHTKLLGSELFQLAAIIVTAPLLLWVAVRRTAIEASMLLAVMTTATILALAVGAGPISLQPWPVPESLSWIAAILAIQSGTVLMLAANRAEQLALETEKIEQAARMRSIVDAANDGVISINEKGIVETFSKSAERLFGFEANEVIGNNIKMLMPDTYADHHDGYIRHYLETNERRIIGIGRLVTGRRKDGSEFPMELSVGEARHGNHRVFTGFIRDVTERQETEQRLHELQDELLHVSRLSAMGELAAALGHELNQPLTAIKNYSQAAGIMLKKDLNTAELPRILEKTAEQAGRAGEIIRRLRTFVTARQVEKSAQKVNQLVEEACALALVGAREDGIKSRIVHGNDLPAVQVDRIQIQQILINLVRNAVDAVRQAPVREVTVRSGRSEGVVTIEVVDTGPGLTEQGELNLFKPFMTTKPGGMGIGLSLSRGIAEAHGGTLTYRRNPEGGAVFTLTLPIEPAADAETATSTQHNPRR